ncbi:MAG: PhoPQ-activated pathogenicity-related family protein [Pirellulales bacterium]
MALRIRTWLPAAVLIASANIFSLCAQEKSGASTTAIDPVSTIDLPVHQSPTALDRYVAAPDDSFAWKIVAVKDLPGAKMFVVDMTSQTWLTPTEVDRTKWQHWLTIVKPNEVKSSTAMMFIGGGGNGGAPPDKMDDRVLAVANGSRTVVAELKQVPNQPLVFHGDGKPRVEDDLIGYTWDQYIKTGDERWPARLPMVKSVVRAMDVVQTLLASDVGGNVTVDKFVVAGGSKRGWTTWMTAAVDKRVAAIAPIVIDVLNVDKSMRHHYAAYGFWAPAITDYVDHKIVQRRNHPRYAELMRIEDPFAYRDRFTMPKCIINASGDQFFLPDSSQFYFNQLPGEKHLCYVPNTDHGLGGSNALDTLIAFHYAVAYGVERPSLEWHFENGKRIVAVGKGKLNKVLLWEAHNPADRDFRVETFGRNWTSRGIEPQAGSANRFDVSLTEPDAGWKASFLQFEFDIGAPVPLRLTTEVRVLPDTLPFLARPIPTLEFEGVTGGK